MNRSAKDNQSNRRSFIKRSAGLTIALPSILPSLIAGRKAGAAPSDKIRLAIIGLGTMGQGHLFGEAWTYIPGGFISRNDVEIAAVCDVVRAKREQTMARIDQFFAEKYGKEKKSNCQAYVDFREILERDDVDAVLIATPIHWHATMSALAARAGKDIYCEKPTAVTINESKAVVKAVLENQRIFQAGTQQRSEYDAKFRKACEYIRNGRLGTLKEVYVYREGGGAIWPEASGDEVPIPDGLDWDLWLGPAPKIPYQGRADAHLFGFGGINWGQHHYDILQWALDADRTGPIEIFLDEGKAAYRYANGVVAYGRAIPGQPIGETGGGWYIGTEGKIGVDREHLVSEPAEILEKPLTEDDIRLYKSESHSINFLECIKTRKPTICDVETAHRAVSVLLLGGIAQHLNRSLKWDPKQEQFIDDEEANNMLSLPKREPWVI